MSLRPSQPGCELEPQMQFPRKTGRELPSPKEGVTRNALFGPWPPRALAGTGRPWDEAGSWSAKQGLAQVAR